MVSSIIKAATLLAASSRLVNCLTLDVGSSDSIKNASSALAKSIINIYNQGQRNNPPAYLVGVFESPYWWWTGAFAWGSLIDYRTFSNDSTYDANITAALVTQSGNNRDYRPGNYTALVGNDDQAYWALAAMDAVEYGFANPSNVTWLQLATNVWNDQVARWDNETCNGGLRWQIFAFNNGYDYKNLNSNAALFQLSARLARYTDNQTYTTWADKTYNWIQQVGLVNDAGHVYDGTTTETNCTQINRIEWTNNNGVLLYGTAILYNTTSSDTWRTRTQALVNSGSKLFFTNGTQILTEVACESITPANCNTDQLMYKGAYARWLAKSVVVAPFLSSAVTPLLQSSAKAAAASCGDAGDQCQVVWYSSENSSSRRGTLGSEISALGTVESLLILGAGSKASPLTQAASNTTTGGSTGTSTNTSSGTPAQKTGAAVRQLPGSIIGAVVMVCLAMFAI